MQIRILLVDDHRILREGLRVLLAKQPGFVVCGEAGDGRAAVQMAIDLTPDIVVMDMTMPSLNGVDATRQILAACRTVKVVCLSAHADQRLATAMFKAGAMGYVLKESAFDELTAAIHTVLDGKIYLSPTIAGLVVNGLLDGRTDGMPVPAAMSPREREVLQSIAEGRSTKEIAAQFQVSIKTIETHRRNLMAKLKIDSVAELTKYAVREGLTTL